MVQYYRNSKCFINIYIYNTICSQKTFSENVNFELITSMEVIGIIFRFQLYINSIYSN